MPKLGSRLNPNDLKVMELSNFEGGYRTSVSNEAVEPNEMPNCINWEYDSHTRGLKTADGIRALYTAPALIKSSFRDTVRHLFYYQDINDNLYVTSLDSQTLIGKLSGTSAAMYCPAENNNGRVILVASGGTLQYVKDYTLTTITGAPEADIIMERLGRYIAANTNANLNKNRMYYSGVADYTDWPDSSVVSHPNNGKWIDIGIGAISAIGQLEDFVVVFMNNGKVYTIQYEYPDWYVQLRKENVFCVNRFCVVQAFDDLYFYGPQGFNSFKTVVQYGDFKTFDTGTKINLAMKAYAGDQSRMWFIPSKGQIWIKPRKDGFVYMFHGFNKAFTTREFLSYTGNVYNDVQDVCVDGPNTFVVLGQKITILDPDIATLDGKQIEASLTSKLFVANYHYHIVRVEIGTYNIVGGDGVLMVGEWPIPLRFMDGGICIVDDVDKDANGVAIPSDTVTHTLFDIAIDMNYSSTNEPIYTAVLNGTYTGSDYRDIVSHDGQLEGDFHDIWEQPTTTIRTKMNYRTPAFDLELTIKNGAFSLRYIRIYYREI